MQPANFFVFFGLIATGKSTLAQAWAERQGLAYYNSDVVRKELAGLDPSSSQQDGVDQGIYTKEFSLKTYDALLDHAKTHLEQGRGVVLDASYQSRSERDRLQALAQHLDLPLYFILCECPEDEMRRRMEQRAKDPNAVSDGRWEIYLQQKERFEVPAELPAAHFITINTNQPLESALDSVQSHLNLPEV